jgi:hypothetical protein
MERVSKIEEGTFPSLRFYCCRFEKMAVNTLLKKKAPRFVRGLFDLR